MVAATSALLLGTMAVALCAPQKRQQMRTGKQVGELCVKMNKTKNLQQVLGFVTGGCMVITAKGAARDQCIKQGMARVKQLRPNIR